MSHNTDLPQSRGIHAAVAFVLGATCVRLLKSSLVPTSSASFTAATANLPVGRPRSNVNDAAAESFASHISHLRQRGGMYIQPFDYDNLVSHVLGYDMAARQLGFAPPLEGMGELVQLRFGRECALTWMAMLKTEFTEPDGDPKETFFQFYDDLVAIRTEKGLEYLHAEFNRMAQFKRKRPTNPKWPASV